LPHRRFPETDSFAEMMVKNPLSPDSAPEP